MKKQRTKFFNLLKLLTLVGLLQTTLFGFADQATQPNPSAQPDSPPIYQVNLIVFKMNNLENISPTLWHDYTPAKLKRVIQLLPSNQSDNNNDVNANTPNLIQQNNYQLLPENQFMLQREAHRIRRNKSYQILSQRSWFQPIAKRGPNIPVVITGGQFFGDNGPVDVTSTNDQNSIDNENINPIENNIEDNNHAWELQGTINLKQSAYQYINLKAKFELTEMNNKRNSSNSSENNSPFQSISLNETRRLLPNKINYLDSPTLGVVVLIRRLALSQR